MSYKQRLELDWIGKDDSSQLEPRILIQSDELGFGDIKSTNKIIQGDNLLALKALENDYTGGIQCVFIDPPYNTGSAFQSYDDGLEHSLWLSMMKARIEILQKLMSESGSLWITIDDNEAHYLKVLCDEIFGRHNFVANIIWEKSDSPRMDAKTFSVRHDHILVYSKNKESLKLHKIEQDDSERPAHFNKIDENKRYYYLKPLRSMGAADRREDRPSMYFALTAPDGTKIFPVRKDGSDGRWRWGEARIKKDKELIEWVKGRNGWTPYYKIYHENATQRPPETIWTHLESGSNRTSAAELKALFDGQKVFDTPKPEKLIYNILKLATDEGDVVLDSFAGSGTTGAVAHKLNRKWILVEIGLQASSIIQPRLTKVVSGEDQGGVSSVAKWQGGGGFKFYKLASSLLQKDDKGNWIINNEYNALQLAEAVCKHEKFKFYPHESIYWKQGYSSEKDFIFVTTQFLTSENLDRIQEQMQKDETLLICAKAFRVKKEKYTNITLKKIPQMLLGRCEFGRDDYSLNIREEVQEDLEMDLDA